jgi:transcriptional regulator of acetoin/glycerol metabolism
MSIMATPKKTASKKPAKPTFAEIGREAAKKAQRDALLAELKAEEWNLSAVAVSLKMGTASTVIRAIRALDLSDDYEKARTRGDVRPGPRAES